MTPRPSASVTYAVLTLNLRDAIARTTNGGSACHNREGCLPYGVCRLSRHFDNRLNSVYRCVFHILIYRKIVFFCPLGMVLIAPLPSLTYEWPLYICLSSCFNEMQVLRIVFVFKSVSHFLPYISHLSRF